MLPVVHLTFFLARFHPLGLNELMDVRHRKKKLSQLAISDLFRFVLSGVLSPFCTKRQSSVKLIRAWSEKEMLVEQEILCSFSFTGCFLLKSMN